MVLVFEYIFSHTAIGGSERSERV